jgi:hypothetical protein
MGRTRTIRLNCSELIIKLFLGQLYFCQYTPQFSHGFFCLITSVFKGLLRRVQHVLIVSPAESLVNDTVIEVDNGSIVIKLLI